MHYRRSRSACGGRYLPFLYESAIKMPNTVLKDNLQRLVRQLTAPRALIGLGDAPVNAATRAYARRGANYLVSSRSALSATFCSAFRATAGPSAWLLASCLFQLPGHHV